MKNINKVCEFDIAALTAFRFQFELPSNLTFDDRPQVLKDLDRKRGVRAPWDKNPYIYSDLENVERNRDLKAFLLQEGYGVVHWREDQLIEICSIELSQILPNERFFVVNIENAPDFYNQLFTISEYYNQRIGSFQYWDCKKQKLYLAHCEFSSMDEISDGEEFKELTDLDLVTIDDYQDNDKMLIKQIHDDICANIEKMKSN